MNGGVGRLYVSIKAADNNGRGTVRGGGCGSGSAYRGAARGGGGGVCQRL
ncbi:unnamed protein product [Spirodela intermedia]|uniref:Uncharacterized protein n=1 Tax=Spirodela intermedia TaxID=51605 RepID=A0ABN7ECE7_SPIIN|nr:unnamed protein product [Spirodela intermedia]